MISGVKGVLLLVFGGLFFLGGLTGIVDSLWVAIVYDVAYLGGVVGSGLVLLIGYFLMSNGWKRIKNVTEPTEPKIN